MTTLEREGLTGPRLLQNLNRLRETRSGIHKRNLKRVEFFLYEAQADAEDESAFREIVDHGNLFSDMQRMKQW